MSIYREYDIRGIVGTELTEALAERIGRAYASLARGCGARTVAVGRDGRLTSPALREHLVAGLTQGGLSVEDLGICPTPLMYYALFRRPVDGGIMVTGSHNAAEYNGLKLCMGTEAFHGEDIQALRRLVVRGSRPGGPGPAPGSVWERSLITEYAAFLQEHFAGVDAAGLPVVIDCGSATAGLVAPKVLEHLGCHVTVLHGELDGRFPHHHPDPTVEENLRDLQEAVVRTGAALGIGYDGDADRIGVVDEQGAIIWGDRLLVLYAREILARKPGSTIISEVKASQLLYDDITRRGGQAIMAKTGHSLIKAKLKAEAAVLAGEMSGHMFFADRYFGYDDAIYASCRLIELLVNAGQSLSALLADLPSSVVTPEIRVECPDECKFDLVHSVKQQVQNRPSIALNGTLPLTIQDVITIDGIRIVFEDGWGLVRASNTQPALVLRFEAASPERLAAIRAFVEAEVEQARQVLMSRSTPKAI